MFNLLLALALVFQTNVYAADKKISELVLLPAASFATGDLMAIVDVSAGETKRTRLLDFDVRYVVNPFTTSGDGIYYAGGVPTRLAIGAANTVWVSNGTAPSYALLTNSNLASGAAVAMSKLAALTASRVLVSDGSGVISPAAVTATTLTYLDISSSLTALLALKAPLSGPTFTGVFTGPWSTAGPLITSAGGVVTSEAQLAVTRGGTGLASGTSGGVLAYTGSGTIASSAALTQNALVIGGGAGAAPSPLGSLGTTTTLLHGNAAGAPTFGAVALASDVSGTLPIANGGTGLTSGTSGGILGYTASGTLASSGALTQNAILLGGGAGATPSALGSLGTTTTVLHGNAAGAPTFGAVGLATDVSGTLPIANGGTNNGSLAVTAGGTLYTDGTKIMNAGAGTSGFVWTSNGASAPSWTAVAVSNTVVTKSSNATLTSADNTVLCDTSSGNVTLTFPAAASNSGVSWVIKKTSASNLCIIDGNSSETTDGDATISLVTNNASAVIFSDGTNLRTRNLNDPWRVDINISGANVSLGTVANATYSEMTNGSLTMTQNTGSIAAQITCAGTNSPTGTTCSVGNEAPGVVFTLPKSGSVRACMAFTHQIINAAGGATNTYFNLVETASNAQTVLQEGKDRFGSGYNVASNTNYTPVQVCGTFQMTSIGLKAIRLFFEQEVGGTVTSSLMLADAAGSSGQRDIHLTIYPQ